MHTRNFIKSTPLIAWIMLYAATSIGIFANLLGIITPKLQAALQVDYKQISLLMLISMLGSLCGAFLGGDIAKRFDVRGLMLTYIGLMLVFTLLIVNTQQYVWLIVGFTCMSLVNTALFTLGHTLLAHLSDDADHRTRILSLVDVGFSMGALCAPLWGGLWMSWKADWNMPYLMYLGLLVLLLLMLVPQSSYPAQPASTSKQDDDTPPIRLSDYLRVLHSPVVMVALLALMAVGFVEWGQALWLMSYVVKGLNLSDTFAHTSVFCLMLGMLSGRIWHAFWLSRWSANQKLQGLAVLCAVGVLAQNLLGLIAGLESIMVLFWLCSYLIGLGMSVAFPILLGRMIDHAPEQAPRLSALAMLAISIGSSLAALSIGYLADAFSIRQAFFVFVLAALTYLGFVVWLVRLAKPKPVVEVLLPTAS